MTPLEIGLQDIKDKGFEDWSMTAELALQHIRTLTAEIEQLTDDASSWHTKYLRESLESERLTAEGSVLRHEIKTLREWMRTCDRDAADSWLGKNPVSTQQSSEFSKFIRSAPSEGKEAVFQKVIDDACNEQNSVSTPQRSDDGEKDDWSALDDTR